MTNTEAQSAPDNRLICNCGELGIVTPCEPEPGFGDENGGYRVFCQRDGKPCCMSHLEPTPELAIAAFVRLQAIPAAFEPMDPDEVLRRAEAFDPLAIMPELQRIKDANLSSEETLSRQASAALNQYNQAMGFSKNRERIMRLALQMIVAKSNPDEQLRLASSLCGGAISTLDHICKVAEQALRECS